MEESTPVSTPAARPPRLRRARLSRASALATTLGIVLLCIVAPPAPSATEGLGLDKLFHFGAFALCAWLWRRSGLTARAVFALGAALALGTEAVQGLWLADRRAEAGDLFADLLGTAVGLFAARGSPACATSAAAPGGSPPCPPAAAPRGP